MQYERSFVPLSRAVGIVGTWEDVLAALKDGVLTARGRPVSDAGDIPGDFETVPISVWYDGQIRGCRSIVVLEYTDPLTGQPLESRYVSLEVPEKEVRELKVVQGNETQSTEAQSGIIKIRRPGRRSIHKWEELEDEADRRIDYGIGTNEWSTREYVVRIMKVWYQEAFPDLPVPDDSSIRKKLKRILDESGLFPTE